MPFKNVVVLALLVACGSRPVVVETANADSGEKKVAVLVNESTLVDPNAEPDTMERGDFVALVAKSVSEKSCVNPDSKLRACFGTAESECNEGFAKAMSSCADLLPENIAAPTAQQSALTITKCGLSKYGASMNDRRSDLPTCAYTRDAFLTEAKADLPNVVCVEADPTRRCFEVTEAECKTQLTTAIEGCRDSVPEAFGWEDLKPQLYVLGQCAGARYRTNLKSKVRACEVPLNKLVSDPKT